MANPQKIIGWAYFNHIVVVLKESDGDPSLRAYIGEFGLGDTIQSIAENGAKFPIEEAKSIIKKQGELNPNYKGTIIL
jgi:hypothetical protein